tara:strand:- start:1526 stop:1906 length:381 start_codon:yes stop_codon:yes gene_type:complete
MGIENELRPEKENSSEGQELDRKKEQLKLLREQLESMEGHAGEESGEGNPDRSEMRKILDKEYELNSAQSPIDATDPNRKVEYEEWVGALDDSKKATQGLKLNLERRIEDKKTEISRLEEELKEEF